MTGWIYHLALAQDWRAAVESGGPYERSTLGKSLQDEGFIHCSFASQVQRVADLVYRGRGGVVLVTIDPARLSVEVRVESVGDHGEQFPHIYGPLPLEAVIRADPLARRPDGTLVTEPFVEDA